MSAILGVFTDAGPGVSDDRVRRMLARMRSRGAQPAAVWRSGGAVMAVARHPWEGVSGFSGPVGVLREGDQVIAADASLYYRDDLRRRMRARGVEATGDTPSHLILAAYRAWGERCAEHLEGDFAFAIWDERTRALFCARDFGGLRSLYYADLGGTFVVATSIGAVLEHPACPDDLNLVAIAETAGELFGASHETCYRSIFVLPAARSLTWRAGAPARLAPHWDAPEIASVAARGPAFEQAAEELRELLIAASAERLAMNGPTSVWMSGGYDSTAVFGAGEHAVRSGQRIGSMRIVSISYPPGDRGREDELITAVADHWKCAVHWLRIQDVPFLPASPAEAAATRDEPFAHLFEMWNRALARGSREVGAHVGLSGNGGDQLFAVSWVYLADLLKQGRLFRFAREWRAIRSKGLWALFDYAIRPLLPPQALRLGGLIRGRRAIAAQLEQRPAPWITTEFARAHGLAERERRGARRRPQDGAAAHEMYWTLTYPLFPRVMSHVFQFGLEEGVEARQPLLDARIVAFAASRPVMERCEGRATKRLLRHAMRGLVPDAILAPRATRTGTVGTYLDTALRKTHAGEFADAFRRPVLADLGIVDQRILWQHWERFLHGGEDILARGLFYTFQTELWLRSRLGSLDSIAAAPRIPQAIPA